MAENRKIRARRAELGLTQAQLADLVDGIYTPDISRIEAGGWLPPESVRNDLARALQTTPDALWGDALLGAGPKGAASAAV